MLPFLLFMTASFSEARHHSLITKTLLGNQSNVKPIPIFNHSNHEHIPILDHDPIQIFNHSDYKHIPIFNNHSHGMPFPFNSTSPHADIISITIRRNWSEVCHHIKSYLADLCTTIKKDPLEECEGIPLAIGNTLCFRGICICLGFRRSLTHHVLLTDLTMVTAEVRHRSELTNKTAWPAWVQSIQIIETPEEPPYTLLAMSALCALLGLVVVGCAVRFYQRYLGYRKLEPINN